MSRLLLVSNRLPVTIRSENGQAVVTRSSGGLVAALDHVHHGQPSIWIGSPGDLSSLERPVRESVERELREENLHPVAISAADNARYYDGFSNNVLWPLCHYLLDRVHVDAYRDWSTYREVNQRFADAILRELAPGDAVWVHDYHLALVPALVRAKRRNATIGFFLHVPFPAAEAFRILPWREQILRGLLGADVIGFHTASYAYHFTYAVSQLLGTEPGVDVLRFEDRQVRVGAFPIGIDAGAFEAMARSSAAESHRDAIRDVAHGRKIVLGVDRVDYTKGIPRRLMAIERLLERQPKMAERLHCVQVAVPTRENNEGYADYRRAVNELVGRINGTHGSPTWAPIHLVHRQVDPSELVGLYTAADVMVVTPIRDGMNLVAKEYVATRLDETGALVLSEFAGAASELHEAVQVNPYDVEAIASGLSRALDMPEHEQRFRMHAMRRSVRDNDVEHWMKAFLEALSDSVAPPGSAPEPSLDVAESVAKLRTAESLIVFLDCDGTLLPFAKLPHLAMPDTALLALLERLSLRPHTLVHLVSGRPPDALERWFGPFRVGLHGEHGLWSRPPGAPSWTPAHSPPVDWKDAVRTIVEEATRRTSGSVVEEKSACIAWHYRATEPQLAAARAAEVRMRLAALTRENDVLELFEGPKVIEVRPHGVHKGLIVGPVLGAAPPNSAILAMGDDRTDEDLFAALPEHAVTIHVGPGRTHARFRVADYVEARAILEELCT